MHPDLTAALAAEHRNDLAARATSRAAAQACRPRTLLPHYKLTWTRTTLGIPAQATAGRPSRSWVIVISATRAL